MNDHPTGTEPDATTSANAAVGVPSARVRALSRLAAGLGLGGLAALLTLQMIHQPLAALGAGLGAGLVAFVAWAPLVLRGAAVSLGYAALVGALALAGGFAGMAVVGGATGGVVTDGDTGIALLFTIWIVAPIEVALALAVAVATRLLTQTASTDAS